MSLCKSQQGSRPISYGALTYGHTEPRAVVIEAEDKLATVMPRPRWYGRSQLLANLCLRVARGQGGLEFTRWLHRTAKYGAVREAHEPQAQNGIAESKDFWTERDRWADLREAARSEDMTLQELLQGYMRPQRSCEAPPRRCMLLPQ